MAFSLITPRSDYMQGPTLKLDRAMQQTRALQEKVKRFIERREYGFGIAEDVQSREGIIYIYFERQPPDEWSVLIGEIIHDLRSCLDHIVYQLTLRHEGKPLPGSEFPIFTDKDVFFDASKAGIPTRRSGEHKIRGIAPLAKQIIRDVQPFNRSDPERHILWVLHEMSNIDKHRVLNLTQTAIDVSNMTVQPSNNVRVGKVKYVQGPIVSGAELARWQVLRGARGTMTVDCNLTVNVAFDDTAPLATRYVGVIDGLDSIIDVVRGVGAKLKPFLD